MLFMLIYADDNITWIGILDGCIKGSVGCGSIIDVIHIILSMKGINPNNK